ncbi:hypothetical protein Acy02nite_21110 [Actinoplanes cyaneus]|uniref:Uncharacterized protein n=1 Tax=Actinoplanes cyaneus TaxID=52696 RepID=A0A919IDT8_9ACTN|nr:hypothetical protein Acy02nite_21110 [Actinoplanes cyaneus]
MVIAVRQPDSADGSPCLNHQRGLSRVSGMAEDVDIPGSEPNEAQDTFAFVHDLIDIGRG